MSYIINLPIAYCLLPIVSLHSWRLIFIHYMNLISIALWISGAGVPIAVRRNPNTVLHSV